MRFPILLCLIAALPVLAQRGREEQSLSCNERSPNQNRMVTHCEMREQTVAFAGRLTVDAGLNGGVTVKSWNNTSVLVRSKVEATGEDESGARAMVSQVRVDVSAGLVNISGPDQSGKRGGWSVSHEIFVPQRADLSIKTHNGGISISDVRGNIQFSALNGGVTLKRLAGEVEGTTTNGGVNVELTGDRYDGNKFDVRTMNGGVNLSLPERYSAHLETGTVNGSLNVNFPMTVSGEISRRLTTDIGSGGPTIHVETTNGGVNIKKATL
jgi:DUF4097 and DUF4098 domain-containing protein YvlB